MIPDSYAYRNELIHINFVIRYFNRYYIRESYLSFPQKTSKPPFLYRSPKLNPFKQ